MSGFLAVMGLLILAIVLVALVRILRGPRDAERLMAAQLLGTGGVAALLLLGSAVDLAGAMDLALVLAVLSAFAAVGFVVGLGANSTSRSPVSRLDDAPHRASVAPVRIDPNG